MELRSGTGPSRGGTCSYTTWTCSTGRGGRVESAASGTTLLLVVVLRVRTYRTRELQPEHWSLLTYHELAKSWLPTVSKSKYPWCCATSFLPFLATWLLLVHVARPSWRVWRGGAWVEVWWRMFNVTQVKVLEFGRGRRDGRACGWGSFMVDG